MKLRFNLAENCTKMRYSTDVLKNIFSLAIMLSVSTSLYSVSDTPEKAEYRRNLAENARAALIEKRLHAIGECGTSRFTICYRALVDNLQDPEPEIREQSIRALGKLNIKDAAEPLTAHLDKEENAQAKYAILWALGYLGNAASSEKLAGLLNDEDSEVRRLSAHSLSNLAQKESLDAINARIAEEKIDVTKAHLLRASLRIKIGQPEMINQLIELLKSPDYWARYHTANTIKELRLKFALKPLEHALKLEEQPNTRAAIQSAIQALRF